MAAPPPPQQQQQLADARRRYLEQATLLTEAAGLVADAQQALEGAPPEAVASLAQHLQAVLLVQRLQLPASSTSSSRPQHAGKQRDAQGASQEGDHAGSRQHLLGVTPQQLRAAHMPSRKAAQKAHAPLLPLLECRLERQAAAAVAAVLGAAAGPDAAAHVVASIEAKHAALAELQQSNFEQLLAYSEQAEAHLAELASIQQVLQQLVGECMLQEQPGLDKSKHELQEARLRQLVSKLQLMQAQMQDHTYDARSLPALAAIRAELAASQEAMQAELDLVESELSAYAQLGDDFGGLVAEYAEVLAKTAELDGIFEKFVSVERESVLY